MTGTARRYHHRGRYPGEFRTRADATTYRESVYIPKWIPRRTRCCEKRNGRAKGRAGIVAKRRVLLVARTVHAVHGWVSRRRDGRSKSEGEREREKERRSRNRRNRTHAARFPEALWRPDVERAVLGATSHAYRLPPAPIGARPLPRMQDGVVDGDRSHPRRSSTTVHDQRRRRRLATRTAMARPPARVMGLPERTGDATTTMTSRRLNHRRSNSIAVVSRLRATRIDAAYCRVSPRMYPQVRVADDGQLRGSRVRKRAYLHVGWQFD